jgi:hypothetical protein
MRPTLFMLALTACGPKTPPDFKGYVEVVREVDPDLMAQAVKPEGQGGVSKGWIVVVTEDVPVYRMWNGPGDEAENRMGQWWAAEAPSGSEAAYRKRYAVCHEWNDLTWVARCTLTAGAKVVVGPTQSVSEDLCSLDGGEAYARSKGWQVFIPRAWENPHLVCPDASSDYRADPRDLSERMTP